MGNIRDETEPEVAHQRSRSSRRHRTKVLIAMTVLVMVLVVGTMVTGNRSGYA